MPRGEPSRPSPKRPRRASEARAGRPEPAPDRHTSGREEPVSFFGIIGHLVHGVAFLTLGAAAIFYLGQVFWVVSIVMGVLALMSLRDAWGGFTRYRDSRKS